ncbi:hypothetical protein D3C71_1567460 [compost metagenome]
MHRHLAGDGLRACSGGEALVHLEDVERVGGQIRQAGIAGAEIIDGDFDAQFADRVDHAQCAVFFQQTTLGGFHHKLAATRPDPLQHRGQQFRRPLRLQIAGGEIHRQSEAGRVLKKAAHVAFHQLQYLRGDQLHDPVFFGNGNEAVGQQYRAVFVLPTQQRFRADAGAIAQVDDGLVQQKHMAFPERAQQLVVR